MFRPFLITMSLAALISASMTSCANSGIFAAKPHESGAGASLAGEWRFALDRNDAGTKERWFARTLADRITLPGVLQAQGFGDEISVDTPWVVTLGDAWWKLQPKALRAHFSQPGHVEVPFLSQPPRHYLGAAWYQRDIEVPAAGQPRRHVLFLERPHWETKVWIDDREYPSNNSLVAPHVTDLGQLAPGKHRLTIRIDNRQIVRDPTNDGHGVDGHSVSDALGATWNGIAGRIELQSTPLVWLSEVDVYPDVRTRTAHVKVRIGNASGQAGKGTLSVQRGTGQSLEAPPVSTAPMQEVAWDANGGMAELELPLGDNPTTWDEFHPVVQEAVLRLSTGIDHDAKAVRFGLREVAWRDKDLLINGRVVNLRTTHFGGDFPLTGYPATDVETWRKMFRVCQDYGLNGMRFHSWCPPEAAFVAADEMGFYLQPECGMWAPFSPENAYTKFLAEETPRLLHAFGNHPSFILLSPSNEPGGAYVQVTPKWASDWYERDPRRLYSAGTGWAAPQQVVGGPQFASLVRFGSGELRNARGWFGEDYRRALEPYFDERLKRQVEVHIPVLAHEVGQWCAYPDFDVINEFTGYLRPSNYHIFRYLAGQTGVLDYNRDFAWASGRFQLACYKEDIEANLRTPGLAGYQLLDLHDYLGQGTALIGVVDAFWKPKRYVTAAEFRRFNGLTVPLARLANRIFTTAETLSADVELYHFAEKPITAAKSHWSIIRADGGGEVANGQFAARDVPIGKNIPLGRVTVELKNLPAPAAYKLVVGVEGAGAENDWNFWLYPDGNEPAVPKEVLLTSDWEKAEAALNRGGKVLFVPGASVLDRTRCPTMKRTPIFWNIQMTVRPPRNPLPQFDAMLGLWCDVRHPALAGFPTEANCDWQWTQIVDGVRSVNLDDAPRSLRPIVSAIDDWNRNWRLGVIFEARVGPGSLLVCTIPVDDSTPASTPEPSRRTDPVAVAAELRQLRRSLLEYMATDRFRPATTLTIEQVRGWWKVADVKTTPRSRVFDPDLDDGSNRSTKKP